MNKLFRKSVAVVASMGVLASTINVTAFGNSLVSEEFTAAYEWLYENGGTTMPSEEAFMPYASVTREQLPKLVIAGLSAASCVALEQTRTYDNNFSDLADADDSLEEWIVMGYEHELVNGADGMYMPMGQVNRAQAMTVIGRALYGTLPEPTAYWSNYYSLLNEEGIFTTENAMAPLRRYELALVLYRIAMSCDEQGGNDDNIDDILCQILGTCEDDADDNNDDDLVDEDEQDEQDEVDVDVDGSVLFDEDTDPAVTAVAKGASVVAASFNVESMADDDVRLTSLVVTANGLFANEARDSLEDATLYIDGQRVSRVKSSFNSDDEAIISFLDGGYDLGEGDAVVLDVVVTVKTTAETSEVFFLELADVNANAEVEIQDATGPEFTVSPASANEITISAGSASADVRAGENEAEIFSFELEADQNEDITVHAITFESTGSADAEDTASNFVLRHGNDIIATADEAMGDYVTFVFEEPLTIEEDDKETFYVHADIGTDGIGDELEFRLETTSDLVAEDEENGRVLVNIVGTGFDPVTIEAGELTLNEIEIEADELRIDKDNVVLGHLEVDNRAGNEIELQEFGIEVTLNDSSVSLNDTFEAFEVVINGDVYELDIPATAGNATGATLLTGTYSDNSIDVILPAGVSEFTFRADILDTATPGASFELALDNVGTSGGNFYVEELAEDEPVTDIVPSSLSWNSIELTDSDVEVSFESIADRTVVKGTDDVKVSTFRVEAGESDDITMSDVVVNVALSGAAVAYNQVISAIRLTDGQGNVLDEASGNDVASDGDVDFNSMDNVVIPADEADVFHVYVDVVDGNDAANQTIEVSLVSIDFEDEDNDDVTATPNDLSTLGSANTVTVENAGSVVSSFNTSDDINEDSKTILGGDSAVVYSVELIAENEGVDVDTVVFTLTGAGLTGFDNINDVVAYAALWLDGELIDTNSNADISSTGTITFDNMNDFIIPEFEVDMQLQLYTNPIGNNNNGAVLQNARVDGVQFIDAEGESSNDAVTTPFNRTEDGALFSVVPATLVVALNDGFGVGDDNAEFTIEAVYGDNTKAASNADPDVVLVSLEFADGNTTA
jgi:hypothetical protein